MKEKFCLDKRILLLLVFALPLIMVTAISVMVNSQKINNRSKASEQIMLNSTSESGNETDISDIKTTCFNSKTIFEEQKVNILSLSANNGILSSKPLKIYYLTPYSTVYVGLITPSLNEPLYSIDIALFPDVQTVILVGVQSTSQEEEKDIINQLVDFSPQCSPVVVHQR